jgi:molybdopterin-containing oxidoreductase family molybdopterin binding subunit
MREKREERWAYSHCAGCYAACGIRVKLVDGVMVKAEGIPDSDFGSQGGLCGKGHATLMDYYDPNRCNYPVKRTNPNKGLNEDPRWQRISWDEALDTITEKLKAVRGKDPRRLIFTGTPVFGSASILGIPVPGFFISFGTPNYLASGVGTHCGAASHEGAGLFHASWSIVPDYRYCNYVIQFGSNKGTGSGHGAAIAMRQAAEARARGMRFIVFDPICNFSGGKATEWYPILPATDCAVVLSMCNLIVNEIGIYDKGYIRDKTNGPYLAGADKRFVRDKESGKPLLWDEKDGVARTYDDPTLSHPAIEGEYTVNGVKCRPAFQLIKEHLKQYDPAWAAEVSTVPEHIIRRVAREFVDEAKIGSTIEIEGLKLPYRPASAIMYKGGQGHQNGFSQYLSIQLLNALVGNQEAVGGTISWAARSLGYPETGNPRFEPYAGDDGYLTPKMWFTRVPWPPVKPKVVPQTNLCDIFTHAPMSIYPLADDFEDIWDKLGHPYDVDVVAIYGANIVKNACNPETAARILSKVPFIWSINTAHNETTEGFADIVLPDCHFLESCNAFASITYFFNYPMGLDDWAFHCRMPAVEPQYERRELVDILYELANRLGFRDEYNNFLDNFTSMRLSKWEVGVKAEGTIIKAEDRISARETSDRILKFLFGEERGVDWFKEHGFASWKKRPEETYWRWFINARVPIYQEFLEDDREPIKELAEKAGIHMQWERYTALLSYFPSVLYTEVSPDSEFDMFAVSFKDIAHTGSYTAQNPWLDEITATNPYTYNVMMSIETAKKRGIREGDIICLENIHGDKVTGKLKLMKGIHPRVVAMCGHLGSWAKGKPIARGKGVNMNTLIRIDHKHVCPITLAPETAARIKVYKAGGNEQ